jgi:serine/threonine protein kinase
MALNGVDPDLGEVIGMTASGVVYRARQVSLQQDIAVTVGDPSSSSPKALARFLVEVQRLAALHHPNVAQADSLGIDPTAPYIAMGPLLGVRR